MHGLHANRDICVRASWLRFGLVPRTPRAPRGLWGNAGDGVSLACTRTAHRLGPGCAHAHSDQGLRASAWATCQGGGRKPRQVQARPRTRYSPLCAPRAPFRRTGVSPRQGRVAALANCEEMHTDCKPQTSWAAHRQLYQRDGGNEKMKVGHQSSCPLAVPFGTRITRNGQPRSLYVSIEIVCQRINANNLRATRPLETGRAAPSLRSVVGDRQST